MLTEVKNNIRLVKLSIKYNIIKAMDNRVSFIGQVLGMILNDAIMIVQWVVLFSLKDNIGGYGFSDVLLLWGIAAGIYGVAHTLFDGAFTITDLILAGKLDAFLVQPKNTLLYVTTSKMAVSAFGDLVYALILLLVVHPSITTCLLYILFIVLGGIICAAFSIILHSLSFYFGSSEDIAHTLNSAMVNFATYPDGIFDEKTKILLLTIIPVGWAVYVPMNVLMSFNLGLLISILLFTLFITTLAYIIFKNGLKRYSSSNLMSARI